ncbi:MAG: LLM class flavin-dependent oxidoreductase, partial [Gammaproteobacteria bacterium]
GEFVFDAVEVAPRPLQAPLEIWFGGRSKAALERVARSGDGWLTAAATPDEAAAGRETIIARAAAHGRRADPEHFGISIPYSRTAPRSDALATLRQRRPEGGLDQIVAVGAAGLRDLIERHTDGGLSKFVLRPLDAMAASGDWRGELEWLAEVVLPLQT